MTCSLLVTNAKPLGALSDYRSSIIEDATQSLNSTCDRLLSDLHDKSAGSVSKDDENEPQEVNGDGEVERDHPATLINALRVQKSYLLRPFADERISITEKRSKTMPPSREAGVRFSEAETRSYQTTIGTLFQEFEEQMKNTVSDIDALKKEWENVNAEIVALQREMMAAEFADESDEAEHRNGKSATKATAGGRICTGLVSRKSLRKETRVAIKKLTTDAMKKAEGEEKGLRTRELEFRKQMMENLQAMDY